MRQVDAAYDAVLLRSLTKRRSGTAVSLDVKYADVKVSSGKPLASNTSAKGPGSAMGSSGRGSTAAGVRGGAASSGDGSNPAASLLAALPTVRSPDASQLAPVAALFAALGLAALATGVVHTPGTPDPAPSVPLAFGFAAALFHLRRKAVSLPRAAGLTSLGLAAGTLMGVLVQSGLHVDIVPLGPLSSPATLVAESALVGMFTVRGLCVSYRSAAPREALTMCVYTGNCPSAVAARCEGSARDGRDTHNRNANVKKSRQDAVVHADCKWSSQNCAVCDTKWPLAGGVVSFRFERSWRP